MQYTPENIDCNVIDLSRGTYKNYLQNGFEVAQGVIIAAGFLIR